MNIIDEKGRLFGRINVIDFVVIVFLLALVPIVYLGYNIAAAKSKKDVAQISVNIQVKFADQMPELVGHIKSGDYEKDVLGRKIGEIISYSVAPQESVYRQKTARASKAGEPVQTTEGSDQIITTIPISNSKDHILATLKIVCYAKNGVLYYGEQPVKIGRDFIFSTDLYMVTGLVTDIRRNG